MKSCRVLIFAGLFFVLFVSGAKAKEGSESKSLPPEKTQMIYDTLLPKEGGEAAGSETKDETAEPAPGAAGMTAERLAEVLREHDIDIQGKPLSLQFLHKGMQVFLLADPQHNRMRLLSPLARLDMLRRDPDFNEVELLQKMLKANYLATGDVRLCVNRHIIWAAFLHPLDSLTERDLMSALDQLAETARKTRGDID